MRVIAGSLRGRRFDPPMKNWSTRPTTDKTRESLFNILDNYFYLDDVRVLDLFSGTGGVSYEFASRGCSDITAVEQASACIRFIRQQIESFGIDTRVNLQRADVFTYLSQPLSPFDIIYADPPYDLGRLPELPDLIFTQQLLTPGGWFVLEHDARHSFETHPRFAELRRYGKAHLSIFKNEEEQ